MNVFILRSVVNKLNTAIVQVGHVATLIGSHSSLEDEYLLHLSFRTGCLRFLTPSLLRNLPYCIKNLGNPPPPLY